MKKWITTFVQITLTAILAWSLYRKVDVGAAWDRAVQVPVVVAVALFALILIQIVVVSWRMKLVTEAIDQNVPLAACIRSVLAGAFVGQTPLTNFGGDLVRIWCVTREGLSLRNAASVVALDRVLGLISLVLMVVISDVWLWPIIDNKWARFGILLGTAGAVGGIGTLLIVCFMPVWTLRFRLIHWLAELSIKLRDALLHVRYGIGTLGLGIVCNVLSIAVIYVLFRTLGASVSLIDCLILVPFPLLLSLLPLSVSGWGVREGALVVAFSTVGVAPETTLAVSVLFGLILLACSLPGSLLLLRYPMFATERSA